MLTLGGCQFTVRSQNRCGGGLSWQRRDDRGYRRIARRRIARLECVTCRTTTAGRNPPRLIAGEQLGTMSALPPKADMAEQQLDVRFVP